MIGLIDSLPMSSCPVRPVNANQVRLLGQYYKEWDAADGVHCILLTGAGGKVQILRTDSINCCDQTGCLTLAASHGELISVVAFCRHSALAAMSKAQCCQRETVGNMMPWNSSASSTVRHARTL